MLQWLIGVRNATTYVGCINKDEFGTVLESKVRTEGVRAVFQYDHTEPTGTCAVCLTGQNRYKIFILFNMRIHYSWSVLGVHLS